MKVLLCALVSLFSVAQAQVTVSSGAMTLGTYVEGLPDVNAPFEQLNPSSTPAVYPYTRRTSFSDKKVDHGWRTLTLENEYLKCIFLPDLAGHLYNCVDKINGADLFYANPSIRKNAVALRGAFAAVGVEFNFPVGHSWVTVSPVQWATRRNADGSATVVLSSVDRVTGMEWRVEATLRPGVDLLEDKLTLYNRSEVRRPYSCWTNAAVRLQDEKTIFVMPTALAATHGFAEVDTWPVNSAGIDMSAVTNHKIQTAFFAYGSREPFLAVYQPKTRTGTIHYADASEMPGKKIWSWGSTAEDGDRWVRRNLSDDGSTYVEIQAGLFDDQETFQFLEPQQVRTFTEYWMPARNLGGISRANRSAALFLQRSAEKDGKVDLSFELETYRQFPNSTIQILDGNAELLKESVDLDPTKNYSRKVTGLAAEGKYRVQIMDGAGAVLLAHTEGGYEALTAQDFKIGKQRAEEFGSTSEADFLKVARYDELHQHLDFAASDYRRGLKIAPDSVELLKGAGRLSVVLNRFAEAMDFLQKAEKNATSDPEIHYYLGLAYAGMGRDDKAKSEFAAVGASSLFSRGAAIQTAALLSRGGNWTAALAALRPAIGNENNQTRAGAMEVDLLRHLGRVNEAKSRLAFWQSADPSDLLLRFEGMRMGASDPAFFRQLAGDPEQVLNIATELFEMGMFEDSLAITDRKYEAVDGLDVEPAAVLPQEYALVAYYRAYARERLKQKGSADDYLAASRLPIAYVFPSRPGTVPVLLAALQQDPKDVNARALLGSLYFHFRMTDEAIAEWQGVRAIRKDVPGLQRNLGRALLQVKKDVPGAIEVLREGVALDASNQDLAEALKQAEKKLATAIPSNR
jgi:tetratricopeptide (TPR) repeat protein